MAYLQLFLHTEFSSKIIQQTLNPEHEGILTGFLKIGYFHAPERRMTLLAKFTGAQGEKKPQ